MTVPESEHLLDLVQTALDEFETVSLPASMRRSLRIAQLRGDAHDAWFFRKDLRSHGGAGQLTVQEITGFFAEDESPSTVAEQHKELLEVWILERQAWIPQALRSEIPDDAVFALSIEGLLQSQLELQETAKLAAANDDVLDAARMKLRASIDGEIIERIRYRTFAYLCRVERELGYSSLMRSVFERHRRRVDKTLELIAPDVLEMFTAAFKRAQDGDIESLSQCLTSCRRILKAVADAVYPATDTPVKDQSGRIHDVSESKVLNRLAQFVSTTVSSTSATRLTHTTLDEVGSRLDRLIDICSKGVHDSVSGEETEWCVIQTYLVAGEILRLKQAASSNA